MKDLHKKILILSFAVIVLALPVAAFILMPEGEQVFSENENRYLAQYKKPTLGNIKDKRFMNAFDDWFADRFVLREPFIILQNELETLQGKTEINGVFVTKDRLILAWRDDEKIQQNVNGVVASVDSFAQRMEEKFGITSYLMLVPTAQEIYVDTLPLNAQPGNQTALIKNCYDNTEHLTSIDAASHLTEKSDSYIFYRTDHHWTTYGAYLGYSAAAKKMGFTGIGLGGFDVEHASSDFRGTLFSKTLDYGIEPDIISFYTPSGEIKPNVSLSIDTGKEVTVHDSLFLREFLSEKDKYAAFLGQNSPIMDITTDVDSDKSLLVFKDSFAHCMLPFLANHYSRITVMDMRFINSDISEYAELSEYSQILFLYSATNFAEDTGLKKLDLTE